MSEWQRYVSTVDINGRRSYVTHIIISRQQGKGAA